MSEETLEKQEDLLTEDEHARNQGVVEAMLITADSPLSAAKLSSVLGSEVGARDIRTYVNALNGDYVASGRSFRITEVAGGFQFMVHPEFAPWIRQLMKEKIPPRLSPASLETLAILAFKQPITKAEVEHIRGVAVDGVLRQLMEKGIVRISGRSEAPGRPLLYGTTRDFLKHFGLKTLSDLPKLRELEDLLKEEEQRIAQGENRPLSGLIEAGQIPNEPNEEQMSLQLKVGEGEHTPEDGPEESGESKREHGINGTPESISGAVGGGLPSGERSPDTSGQG
ncbi:MAG: SMC-Scp complex subunit ScpB [bacterium]|nr:SMC-Scp complex subunit ScpB [bacterium]